jgi:hypothetical protein
VIRDAAHIGGRDGAPYSRSMLFPTLALVLLPVSEDPAAACRPGDHAPAGVLDVRCPMDGAWMVTLRTSYTRFQGLRRNSHRITTDEALGLGYMQVPESMSMSMTMLELMYAPSDTLTLGASVPWIANSMRMRTNLGERFTMDSSGIGDVQVGADLVAWQLGEQTVSIGLSLGLPSGSITEAGGMPGAPATRLEYALQLGSGTWDITPRADWRMRSDPFTYGVELSGTTRSGHNDQDYALGDRVSATAWGSQEWNTSWSGSVRLTASRWGNVRGADPDLDPSLSPSNDPRKQSGERFDGALGVNWLPFAGRLSGSVIGLEIGIPLAQDLAGPQLSEDWFASLHVGISF